MVVAMRPATADCQLIEAVNAMTDAGLRVSGRAQQGTLGGAIYVQWPDRRSGVVTRFLGNLLQAQRTACVMAFARDQGLPVPRYDLVLPLEQGVVIVQERLPGSPAPIATVADVDAVVSLNDRFAGLLREWPCVPLLPIRPCEGRLGNGGATITTRRLSAHSPRASRILHAIDEIQAEAPWVAEGDDLLHIDLTGPNLLKDSTGTFTGVVDWNLGVYRGDRHLALVKTRFEMEWALHEHGRVDPAARAGADHLDRVLSERVPAGLLRIYWAHRLLWQLFWAIEDFSPDVLDWHFDVAEQRLLKN